MPAKKSRASTKRKKTLQQIQLPTILPPRPKREDDRVDLPVPYYTYSNMVRFTSNPVMYKLLDINREVIETTSSISSIIGRAFHAGMEVYYGGSDTVIIESEAHAIECGLKVAMEYLSTYQDGWIEYSKAIPTKDKALEVLAYVFNSYVKERPYTPEKVVMVEEKLDAIISVSWRGNDITLPVPLRGKVDKVERDADGKLAIVDYKTCYNYSGEDSIDGAKILQAVIYYFLVYHHLKEAPARIRYEEVKWTKNRDGRPQVQMYEIDFATNDLAFDLFFRLYEDITKALNGEMVWVPNLHALFDNEVALISYIHRLDVDEELAKQMKASRVQTVTDLLKKQIQTSSSLRQLMRSVDRKFQEAKNIDYSKMQPEEKIQTKLLEHGMVLQYDHVAKGSTIDLYCYRPSIGLKMQKLKSYVADIEQVLGKSGVRILAPIPNTELVGFEVPRAERSFPALPKTTNGYNLHIGLDVLGNRVNYNITEAPHTLIAGTTGSGKSKMLESIVKQLCRQPKAKTQIVLIDPKYVELEEYKDEKNVIDYADDIEEVNDALKSAVAEMEARYVMMKKKKCKNPEECEFPRRFIIIDEYGDLIGRNHIKVEYKGTDTYYASGPRKGEEKMLKITRNISKEIEQSVLLLAQKARTAGIHLVLAVQRPSVDVITGTIKANFPVKMAFTVVKEVDSQVLIDQPGAEKLQGKGDMLLVTKENREPIRLQAYNP